MSFSLDSLSPRLQQYGLTYLWQIEAIVARVDLLWLESRPCGYTMQHPHRLLGWHRRYLWTREKTRRRSRSLQRRSTNLVCIAGCKSMLGDWWEHQFCIAMYIEVYRTDRWRSGRIRCVHLPWWISDLPSTRPARNRSRISDLKEDYVHEGCSHEHHWCRSEQRRSCCTSSRFLFPRSKVNSSSFREFFSYVSPFLLCWNRRNHREDDTGSRYHETHHPTTVRFHRNRSYFFVIQHIRATRIHGSLTHPTTIGSRAHLVYTTEWSLPRNSTPKSYTHKYTLWPTPFERISP